VKAQLRDYIRTARWFGGKGRDFEVTGSRRLRLRRIEEGDESLLFQAVSVELVSIEYADGGGDLYQVPVVYYDEERPGLEHALLGTWEDPDLGHVVAYDALHDHAAMPLWLKAFAAGGTREQLEFHKVGEPELDLEARSTLFTGEQSNSSVAFGDTSLMKLFRRITPGVNPDIEILAALTEAGNEHVATLYGWVDTTDEDGQLYQLGILQQFLKTASDGWELALASLRNLYADGSLSAEEAGGDFAAEAHRLGVAVAEMHESLAAAFPMETWDKERLGELADAMSRRLDEALTVVPELEGLASGLHAHFDAVRHLEKAVVAQRVHGDLHLGQTLRTVRNWKIIDFEGEPAKPLEERRRPDSAWRDVAGMLRSFDYAAELSRVDHEQATGDADENDQALAREWSERNRGAFLEGYRKASPAEVDEVLLAAYATDKAVYEAVYEARNRPAWLPIPLAALTRLAAET
jgi:maltokinase